MRNIKAKSGIVQLMIGAALLISGPSLQTQIDRIASDPQVQLAKVMIHRLWDDGSVDTTNEQAAVLAEETPAPALQFDSAVAAPGSIPQAQRSAGAGTVAKAQAAPSAPMMVRVNVAPAIPALPRSEMASFVRVGKTDKLGSLPGLTQVEIQELQSRIEKANFRALDAMKKAMETHRVVVLKAEAQAERCTKTEVKMNI